MARRRRASSRRQHVELRADHRCEYCRAPQGSCGYRLHLEHIEPVADGGSDSVENIALACAVCNMAKTNKTRHADPETGAEVELFNPRTDLWARHFRWRDDETLEEKTAKGRATIEALNMNDELRIEARLLWFRVGKLP